MKAKITKSVVDGLKPGQSLADTEVKGFIARMLPSGTISYGYRYYNAAGRQRWSPIGLHGALTPDQARKLAKKKAGEVANDRDPQAERITARARETLTVNAVLDDWLNRDARKRLRTAEAIAKVLNNHVRPAIGRTSIYDLERRDIIKMLDAIEDGAGPVAADRTLAYVRKAFNWYAVRDEKFRTPIIKGMARTSTKERARQRILSDAELRAVLTAAAADTGPFGAYAQLLLLTACRRGEVAGMRRSELTGSDWIIPPERYKTALELVVPLSESARAVLARRPKAGYVFGTAASLGGFSKLKRKFDAVVLAELRKLDPEAELPRWTLHDLRRTARSLMSRAGVPADHAERALGHVIPGVRGTYDRYAYHEEKRRAFEALAAQVDRIVNPPAGDTVVVFPAVHHG